MADLRYRAYYTTGYPIKKFPFRNRSGRCLFFSCTHLEAMSLLPINLPFSLPCLNRVAILGGGISGAACSQLLTHLGIKWEIFDQNEVPLPSTVSHFSLCVYSPGFPPYHPWLKAFYRAKVPCINELDFASLFLKNPIIAVTGTNGKTSVTECLAQLFNQMGQTALAVGNNGKALSQVVGKVPAHTKIVCEISSFQAWGLKYLNPEQVIWTNIAPDHINYHRHFSHYFNSKLHLTKLCLQNNGYALLGPSLRSFLTIYHPRIYTLQAPNEEDLRQMEQFKLGYSVGQQENFYMLKNFCKLSHIPTRELHRCLLKFKQPPHRLHLVKRIKGMNFWEDSKATNLHALQAALESFKKDSNVHWVLGGQSKGEDLTTYVEAFSHYPNVRKIYFIGDTGPQLYHLFTRAPRIRAQCILAHHLNDVFKELRPDTQGVQFVFCPGFSSWDQFKNYAERGEYFEKGISKLAQSLTVK